MRNIIAGTVGHIDHGKTALVRALTGIDTDRLEEEKRRGISIDLGFAHLQLSNDIRISLIDVPGHEKFIKNMLAGVGGIDFVLFIVAADESIKPQTREHFAICRLLDIRHGVVVLTKADLVEPDILDLVRLEVEEFVAGSFLEYSPMVPVSSVTGQGIDLLKEQMREVAAQTKPKDSSRHFRLPIDRSFSLQGFGTVVTGTLISGSIAVEQAIEAYPSGRQMRVRGLQVHGQSAQRAYAGQRTAVNIPGIEPGDLNRGMVLAEPGRFFSTMIVDTRFTLLAGTKPLKHRAPVHFHSGTAEIEAEARMIESSAALAPGQTAYVRFVLREPLLLLPGDRFIVRMFSPVSTIGGGTVLDIAPDRRKRAGIASRLETLAGGGASTRVALLVRETVYGARIRDLAARTGMLESEIGQRGSDLRRLGDWLIDEAGFRALQEKVRGAVEEFHKRNPLFPGIPKENLRGRVLPNSPTFLLDALLNDLKTVTADGEIVRLTTHKVVLKQDETDAASKMEALFREADLAVPSLGEVLGKSGVESGRARSLLQILLRENRLVRINEELVFHRTAILKLKELLAGRRGERFSVPAFKDWTGISRKYAIPLLEFLDRERVTRREGDQRVVL